MSAFVDGYDFDGYVEAPSDPNRKLKLFEPVRFNYRLAGRMEIVKYDAEMDKLSNQKDGAVLQEEKANKFVAEKIKSWDITSKKTGEAVAVNPQNVGQLNQVLFGRLYRILRGTDVCDPDPNGTPAPLDGEDSAKN